MNHENKTPSVAGSEDDWETVSLHLLCSVHDILVANLTFNLSSPSSRHDAVPQADFSNIAQTKTQRQPSAASELAANLRPSAPTFQPRTSKPPTPRLWEPEPPVAPSVGSRIATGPTGTGAAGTGRSVFLGPAIEGREASLSDPSASTTDDVSTRSRTAQQDNKQISTRSTEQDRPAPLSMPIHQQAPHESSSGSGTSPSMPSLSGSTLRPPTILMRREPAVPTANAMAQGVGGTASPFGDDDEWNRDPRSTVVTNSQLWEQA